MKNEVLLQQIRSPATRKISIFYLVLLAGLAIMFYVIAHLKFTTRDTGV